MPLYEYECRDHGIFENLGTIAQSRQPAACPTCDALCSRIVSAPHLACLPRAQVLARDRNERSRHEPKVSSSSRPSAHEHACEARSSPNRALTTYKGARPWVIEHG
jgi:putative FmdB family regulatory protein